MHDTIIKNADRFDDISYSVDGDTVVVRAVQDDAEVSGRVCRDGIGVTIVLSATPESGRAARHDLLDALLDIHNAVFA